MKKLFLMAFFAVFASSIYSSEGNALTWYESDDLFITSSSGQTLVSGTVNKVGEGHSVTLEKDDMRYGGETDKNGKFSFIVPFDFETAKSFTIKLDGNSNIHVIMTRIYGVIYMVINP